MLKFPFFGSSSQHSLETMRRFSTMKMLGMAALIPLLVIPVFAQPITDAKVWSIILVGLITITLFILATWQQRHIKVPSGGLVGATFAIGLLTTISSVVTHPYPYEHLFGFGGVWITWAVVILMLPEFLERHRLPDYFWRALALAGSLITVTTLVQFSGWGLPNVLNQFFGTSLPTSTLFNLTGSPFVAIQFLILVVVGGIFRKLTRQTFSLFDWVIFGISSLGLVIAIGLSLPGKPAFPIILPWDSAWSVMLDSLRTPKTALIGFGPEGFINAYNLFKPTWINAGPFWSVQFSQASNIIFSLAITIGLPGLLAWGIFAMQAAKLATRRFAYSPVLGSMVLASLLLQLLVPPTPLLLITQAFLVACWITELGGHESAWEIHGLQLRKMVQRATAAVMPPATNIYLVNGVVALSGLVVILLGWNFVQVTRAWYYNGVSYRTQRQNQAVATYQAQQNAIAAEPYSDSLRRQYAITNLTIATALAQKTDRSDTETQQLSQLIQQSIRSAKAATVLDPQDSRNWRVLAQVYRALLGLVEGADQWASSAYVETVKTNPADPNVRLELGGVFFALGQYDQAAALFQQAITLKPNFANGYYNLANTLVKLQRYSDAVTMYERTLGLLDSSSKEYTTANSELTQLKAVLEASASAKPNLPVTPAPSPSPSPLVPALTTQNLNETDQESLAVPTGTPPAAAATTTTAPSPSPVSP